ncbi:MAG: ribonuclease J [Alphaproteobacteria bacterium]|nr:ribonuclease J [Alphaproteobacteria bacterium]
MLKLFGKKKKSGDAQAAIQAAGKRNKRRSKGGANPQTKPAKKLKDSGENLKWLPNAVDASLPKPAPKKSTKPAPEKNAPKTIKVAQRNKDDVNDDSVYFFALGGMDHVGMNMYVYKLRGKYLMVDAGFGFLEGAHEGADTKYPDISYLEQVKKDVVAILVTHGHEDHIGAIKRIWPKFRCPIYCTRFVEKILKKDFEELGIDYGANDFKIFDHKGDKFDIAPFNIENFHVSHSVPEANMIIIGTPQGKILHSGDWTFNDGNPIEMPTDYARLREIGSDPDLLALVNESTGITKQFEQTTELEVKETLKNMFASAPQRVILTCYARSIARLKMTAQAAKESGRVACVKGRSLVTFREIGIELGYLDKEDLQIWEDIKDLPANKQVVICTGSQGEKYAQLTRLCRNEVREMRLVQTDTVIFSSIVIPGREQDVTAMYNKLAKIGAHVHTIFDTNKIHASGHAGMPEYKRFYEMVHPFVMIPMHGEYISEMINAKMAVEAGGAKHMIMAHNGEVVKLRRGQAPEIVDTVHVGVTVLEGATEYAGNDQVFRTREKVLLNGAVFVTLPVDNKGYLKSAPDVSSAGIFESDSTGAMKRSVQIAITKAVDALDKSDRRSENGLIQTVKTAVNSALRPQIGKQKKPNIIVHLVRM